MSHCYTVSLPNRSSLAQQASSTHQCEYGISKKVLVHSCCAVLCVILAMICICVLWSPARSGQAKLQIVKPSHRPAKQSRRLMSHGEWGDSVCFEREARMDSFTTVLTVPSCSSMYKLSVLIKKTIPMCNNYSNRMIMWITDPIFCYPQVKNKP